MTQPFYQADAACLFDVFGVDVVIGAVPGRGGFDFQGADLRDPDTGQLLERVPVLDVPTGVFTLAKGVAVTADGRAFTIRDHFPLEDGAITRIVLAPS